MTRTFTSTITLEDAANGRLNNTASVTASALGVAVSDSATAECAFDPFEAADITKSARWFRKARGLAMRSPTR